MNEKYEVGGFGGAEPSFAEEYDNFSDHMTKLEESAAENSEENLAEKTEREIRFEKLVNFFDKDLKIKKALVDLAPSEKDAYGEGPVAYADNLYEGFGDISRDLQSIMKDFYPSDEMDNRLVAIRKDIIESGADFSKLGKVYQQDFADMSETFVKEVQDGVFGYYLGSSPHSFDRSAKSINEMLHLIHHSIVNDENILKGLPVLAENGAEVVLYGL